MKGRPLLLLVISAMLGVLAIGLVRTLMVQQPVPVADIEVKKVVVATAPLRFGDRVTSIYLREVDYLPNSVPQGAFGSIAELTAGEPRVVLETIQTGEPVLASKISGNGAKASLSSIIDNDKRAVTIRVDDVSGTAGFITPADRVDVMMTRNAEGQTAPHTEILLQNIKVLAVDQEANEHTDKPIVVKAVTLEVSPEEAQKIALARTVGQLSLSLRNLANGDAVQTRTISVRDLGGAKSEPAATRQIEIIRGAAPTTYEVKGRDVISSAPANGDKTSAAPANGPKTVAAR
jgi:pilus assembly protein CpaB